MKSCMPHPSVASIGDSVELLITQHIDKAFRRIMPGPNVVVEDRFLRFVTGEMHPFGNFACLSHPADAAGTSAAIEPLLKCAAPSAVFFTGSMPDSAVSRLTNAGFARHGGLPAMAVDIERLVTVALPSGCQFERVTKVSDRDKWGEVFARGYELPLPVGAAFARSIDGNDRPDAPVQYFWIRNAGKPVCTSLLFLDDGVAGIYGVATLPDERGQGLGAYITAQPLKLAHKVGYRVGVLQASEAGYPVYKRLGFSDFGEVPLFVRMPA